MYENAGLNHKQKSDEKKVHSSQEEYIEKNLEIIER